MGPKPTVLPQNNSMVLMPIEPSKYVDINSLTQPEPFSPEPVKVKEEPKDDEPFRAQKAVDIPEVVDLDNFPSDDELSSDDVQTEDTILTGDDEDDIIIARRRPHPSRATNIHPVESDSDEETICAAAKNKPFPERFGMDLEEIGLTRMNVKEHDDRASDWDPEGTPEPLEGASIDDKGDLSTEMRDADEETRRNIRMYFLIWNQADFCLGAWPLSPVACTNKSIFVRCGKTNTCPSYAADTS